MSSYSPKETLSLLASFSQTQALIFFVCNVSSQFFTKRKSIRDFKGGKEAKRKKKAFQVDEKQAKFPAHDKVAQVGKSGING